MINNYTNLELAIIQWCNRSTDDLAFKEQIKNFIFLAEQQIFIDCSTISNQEYVNSVLTQGLGTFPKPQSWGRTLSFYITTFANNVANNTAIERVTLERALSYEELNSNMGIPIYYTDYGANFIRVFPVPDKAYPFLLCYYRKPEEIDPAQEGQTNSSTLRDYPDMLFYCALSKAYAYLHNKEESAFFASLYMDRLKAIVDYDQNRLIDRTINPTTFNDVL